jgi:hypothetical protein
MKFDRWINKWNVDFTTETTQTWTTNGQTKTVQGRAVISDNFAASTGMSVTNGQGLLISPDNTFTDYGPNLVSAPNVQIDLPDIDFGQGPVRFQFDYDISGATQDLQFLTVGLEWIAHKKLSCGMRLGHATTVQRRMYVNYTTGAGASVEDGTVLASTTGTCELQFRGFGNLDARFGTYSGGFPVIASPSSSLTHFQIHNNEAGPDAFVTNSGTPVAAYRMCIAASTGNTSRAWTAKVKRVRIQQWISAG